MPDSFQNSTNGVIHSAAYRDGIRVADVSIANLGDAWEHSDHFLWVELEEPNESTLAYIQAAFGLHELAIEDAHCAHQRPKLDDYGDSMFLAIRTARLAETGEPRIEFAETHVFLGPRYLVIVRHGAMRHDVALRTRCESTPDLLARGESFVLHGLLDSVVDQYFPIIDALEAELGELEEQIFCGKFVRSVTERIYHLQRDLLALQHAITPLVDVSSQLTRIKSKLIPADSQPYFQDVHDHVMRIANLVDNLYKISQTALQSNLALISVAQNDDMKRLAGWAAILAVPTMIAGLYGMNFKYMPETNWVWGYPASLIGMLISCVILYYRFRKIDWL